jgi:2-keto-3-deoxy-6-phosphogluconate aldolase
MTSPQITTLMVGVSKPEQAIAVARAMVADGVQLIELCGGFGPVWTARVIDAIGGAIPVGSVGYGPEAIDQMHALFAT